MLAKINWSPTNSELRTFGKTMLIGFPVIATLLYVSGARTAAAWAGGIGVFVGILAVAAPRLSFPFYVAWMAVGFVMGTIVSSVILTFIFFGLLTPLALLMRLGRRDALGLKKKPRGETYWKDHPNLEAKSTYDRLS